jgi:lipoyl(octanoyl) transferase
VVREDGREDKIAAIGVRVRRWITFHGLSINLSPDLQHFETIVPCGISQHGVTSIRELGSDITMAELDLALKERFEAVFSE